MLARQQFSFILWSVIPCSASKLFSFLGTLFLFLRLLRIAYFATSQKREYLFLLLTQFCFQQIIIFSASWLMLSMCYSRACQCKMNNKSCVIHFTCETMPLWSHQQWTVSQFLATDTLTRKTMVAAVKKKRRLDANGKQSQQLQFERQQQQ